MVAKIHHIGIAVQSIAEALTVFRDGLHLTVEQTETVDDQGVRVAFLPVGDTRLELLEPTGETGTVANFLRRRGEGVHHICLEVEDIEAVLGELKEAGIRLVDDRPRAGAQGARIAFLHPSSTHGVLVELHEEPRCH